MEKKLDTRGGRTDDAPSDRTAGSAKSAKVSAQEKQQQQREQRLARKLERADDLDHLLLWLRTDDAQILRSMLYAFDRSCAKIRAITASLALPLAEGQTALAKAQSWLDQIEGMTAPTGGDLPLYAQNAGVEAGVELPKSLQEKQALRAYRRAIAGQYGVDFYLPKSHEGWRFATALSTLDGYLVRARTVESIEDTGAMLARVGQLIREGHELTAWLAELAKLDYEPHQLLKRALKAERARSTVQEILDEVAETTVAKR
jgi:hypothetical protein